MDTNFEQLVSAFNLSSLSTDVLQQITVLLKQHTDELLSSFVLQVNQSLVTLEHKIWQLLSLNSSQWFSQSDCLEFFQVFAAFNKKLIFHQDNIKDDIKISLLIPEKIDQINDIFQQIQQINDDNDPFITIASLWFENLSFFIREHPELGHLPIIIHINEYFGHHFLMSEQCKSYLIELQQSQISPSIFTVKQLFYMKTCPSSLYAYLCADPESFEYTADQVLPYIGNEYLRMIEVQSYTVEFWSKELVACISHWIPFIRRFLWWKGEEGIKIKVLLPTEKILCDYIQALIRIIDYKPFYQYIMKQRFNDETILIDSVLLSFVNIIQTQNIRWFFRSLANLPDILMNLADAGVYCRIYLYAYGLLSEILTDEHVKGLKFSDNLRTFFFDMLEQGWHDPSHKYQQISIVYLLKGFLNLSKNNFVQEGTAKSNRVSLFIEMCDEYPIAFDIIWTLSFNEDIQQQLRSSSSFMVKLADLAKECDNEQMRKTIHGILWNLEINHEDHTTSETNKTKTFDIMISYSHKDKTLCQQIYKELTKVGYHVWIDFDQMHGNVMDAMAQAIERSDTVIICMSEDYRKSNYCRAEAHYAFQRQRKMVPIVLQKHYKPDGWLLFLIGQLLYVDFIKHEFDRAMQMLLKELEVKDITEANVLPVDPKEDTYVAPPVLPVSPSKALTSVILSQNILEWTHEDVKNWLVEHNLIQMSRLLAGCDGRSLVYLSKCAQHGKFRCILSSLQEDSLRRINEDLSFIELSCFLSLMDQQRRLITSNAFIQSGSTNTENAKKELLTTIFKNDII